MMKNIDRDGASKRSSHGGAGENEPSALVRESRGALKQRVPPDKHDADNGSDWTAARRNAGDGLVRHEDCGHDKDRQPRVHGEAFEIYPT